MKLTRYGWAALAAMILIFAVASWGVRLHRDSLPTITEMARQQHVMTPRYATYRICYDNNSVIGVSFEIQNPSASGKKLVFKRMRAYWSASNTSYIKRTTTAATGGTSSALTVCKNASDAPTSVVTTAKVFTVAPTTGTVDATLDRLQLAGSGILSSEFSPSDSELITIRPGENLQIDATAAITFAGYIEWIEVPV